MTLLMPYLVLAATAQAAPTAATCTSWGQQLQSAAHTSLTNVVVDDERLKGLQGQLNPGAVQARVVNGVCKVSSVGIVSLTATLTLRDPVAGKPIRCPVSVSNAMVPLEIKLGGNGKAPDVKSTTLPLAALGPYMNTCLKARWVTGAVLDVAQGWVNSQEATWYRNIESWLAES